MRPGRTAIPPGKAGLVVLAAALVPIALKKMKPLTRAVGKGMSRFGEMLLKSAEEPHEGPKTEQVAEPPKKAAPRAKAATKAAPKAAARKRPGPKSKPSN
jgi:Sec-independent protein translocase protein TatA